jgi:hypothetical protein
MPDPVADQPPPDAVLLVLNPLLRVLLRSPLGRVVRGPLVVLRFRGRRSGREYRIVAGWHEVDGVRVVFSSARWAVNFRDGAPVSVVHGGRTLSGTGTLVEDAAIVASGLQDAIDAGSSPRMLGLSVERGHRVTPADVRAVGRRMIRLDLPS